jgi:Sigma-70, region 4
MATFDQLPDEQRAIVELVLQQGKSYEELAEMLDIPEARVRERARDALVDLAPVSARSVEADWRGQLADYVLGQQEGPEATATRGHLRRSEAARSWTRSLLDSLEQLYRNGDLPAIPEPDRAARRAPRAAPEARAGSALGPGPVGGLERRWLIAGLGGLVLILLIVLVWPVGVLTGGDDSKDGGSKANANASTPINKKRQGAAVIAKQNGKTQILVQAAGLTPSTQNSAYQVWLFDSKSKRKSLGATATDTSGNLQVVGTLPADYQSWQFIDVTSVTITGSGSNRSVKNGPSVLRGALKLADKPVETGTGKNKATVLAQISLLPLPSSGG